MDSKTRIPVVGDPDRRTVPQLCEELGISDSTIYRYCKQGMPSYLVGGHRVFRQSEVMEWLADRSQQQQETDDE